MQKQSNIYQTKVHWIGCLWATIWIGIGVYLFLNVRGILVSLFLSKAERMSIIYIPFIIGIIKFVSFLFRKIRTILLLDSDGLFAKYGLRSSKTLKLNVNEVQGIVVHKPLVGKVLNYGMIYIIDSNYKQHCIKRISNPTAFAKKVIQNKLRGKA